MAVWLIAGFGWQSPVWVHVCPNALCAQQLEHLGNLRVIKFTLIINWFVSMTENTLIALKRTNTSYPQSEILPHMY